jgi:DNA-binding protein WhiA
MTAGIKAELIEKLSDRDRRFACLYGMLLAVKRFTANEIVFKTTSARTGETFINLINEAFSNAVNVAVSRKGIHHVCSVTSGIKTVCDAYGLDFSQRRLNVSVLDNNNIPFFIAGVFLTCGSMSDPEKDYHLEFALPTSEICEDFCGLLASFEFILRGIERKNSFIAYSKDSEKIEELMTFMGATFSALDIMNVKMLKDVRNKTNRQINCDKANINRQVEASLKHIEAIKKIASTNGGLDSLPLDLKQIAELRLEHTELSLKELGELTEPPLSRSKINYKLKQIETLAEK